MIDFLIGLLPRTSLHTCVLHAKVLPSDDDDDDDDDDDVKSTEHI